VIRSFHGGGVAHIFSFCYRLRMLNTEKKIAMRSWSASWSATSNVRLRPTPAKRLDRLERSCGCGQHPQSVLTVSSARALAADTRKVS
jgi:hypothetical protein